MNEVSTSLAEDTLGPSQLLTRQNPSRLMVLAFVLSFTAIPLFSRAAEWNQIYDYSTSPSYCDLNRHIYFIEGVPVSFMVSYIPGPIDEDGYERMQYRIGEGPWKEAEYGYRFRVNIEDYKAGDVLWLRKMFNDTETRPPEKVNFDIIAPPPGIKAGELQEETVGAMQLKYVGKKNVKIGMDATENIFGIPLFKKEALNF